MSTQSQRLIDLTTRVATECKALRTFLNGNAANLSNLNTTAKNNLVAAINEVKSLITSQIDDNAGTSATKSWSIDKVKSELAQLKTDIVGGAGPAYDTLVELQALLQGEAADITGLLTAVGRRVRTDINTQGLTSNEKQNARTNIDAYGPVELGDPDTDLVAQFNAGL